jgi:voltage-gated potassium channel
MVPFFLVLVGGSLGYVFLEDWTFLDGLYMTVITVTTIGFKEVHDLDARGQVFTIILIFCGIGTVAYAIKAGTTMIIQGELNQILTRRRSMKAIGRIKNHFIVCGFGRMGSFVCNVLHERGIPFVVIESGQDGQDRLVQTGYLFIPGDATREDVLKNAGIHAARGMVSLLDSDAANLYVVLTARQLNPALEIVARAGEESAEKKLLWAGATRVISPYQIGGMRLVMGILKPHVMSFLEVAMDHRQLNIELEEVVVAKDSPYSGKSLIETDIRKELNLIIISVIKQDGQMVFNPGPGTVINDHDTLIAMGERTNLAIFEKKAGMSDSQQAERAS